MIVVDTSVWVDFFNGRSTRATRYLRDDLPREELIVGDLVLCEVLQGFRDAKSQRAAEEIMTSFAYFDMVGRDVALRAAAAYRALRAKGVTVRKTIDVLIATACLERGYSLLHQDRDFDALEEHLGLVVIHPT
jgi:predicted nucleic acid-binding protein